MGASTSVYRVPINLSAKLGSILTKDVFFKVWRMSNQTGLLFDKVANVYLWNCPCGVRQKKQKNKNILIYSQHEIDERELYLCDLCLQSSSYQLVGWCTSPSASSRSYSDPERPWWGNLCAAPMRCTPAMPVWTLEASTITESRRNNSQLGS